MADHDHFLSPEDKVITRSLEILYLWKNCKRVSDSNCGKGGWAQ